MKMIQVLDKENFELTKKIRLNPVDDFNNFYYFDFQHDDYFYAIDINTRKLAMFEK